MSNKPLNPSDYTRLFQFDGYVSYAVSDEFVQAYTDLGGLVMGDERSWISYMLTEKLEDTLQEGLEIYRDNEKYESFRNSLYQTYDDIKRQAKIIDESESLSRPQVAAYLEMMKKYRRLYRMTEFFYTDRAYEREKEIPEIRKNFETFEKLKIDGRTYLNEMYFIPDALFNRLLKRLSGQFSLSDKAILSYSIADILGLFSENRLEEVHVAQRAAAYLISAKVGSELALAGDEAKESISFFRSAADSTTVRGRIAQKGKVRGIAKVIKVKLSEYEKISQVVESMEHGQILIAETTEPSIIAACRKASAIVTNQGGMMSHAAIVSRELGIPCIVGTGNATEVIHDGDMVEVDADNGIVKILKRA